MRLAILRIAVVTAACASLVACDRAGPVAEIADVTRPMTLTLRASGDGNPYAIKVDVDGAIDGDARIELLLKSQPYKSEILRDAVRVRWGGDWYSPEAIVRYTPGSVRSGSITVRYRFEMLQK